GYSGAAALPREPLIRRRLLVQTPLARRFLRPRQPILGERRLPAVLARRPSIRPWLAAPILLRLVELASVPTSPLRQPQRRPMPQASASPISFPSSLRFSPCLLPHLQRHSSVMAPMVGQGLAYLDLIPQSR